MCFWKIGVFRKVTFDRRKLESFVLVYKQHVGHPSTAGPLFAAADQLVRELGLKCLLGGAYLDNPRVTSAEKCRAFVGIRFPEMADLTDDLRKTLAERGFDGVFECPSLACEVAEWPLAPGLLMIPSVLLGVYSIYPSAHKRFDDMDHSCDAVLELYDGPLMQVCFPLERTGIAAEHWKDK